MLNVVDDEPPIQVARLRELQLRMSPCPRVFAVPWPVIRALTRLAWLSHRLLFEGTARVPVLLAPARLHPRRKPLRYANTAIKSVPGWRPRCSRHDGIVRSLAADENGGWT